MSDSQRVTDPENVTEQNEATESSDFGGIASFADAESREILNLLNQGDSSNAAEGGCCGGGCCS